MCAQRITEVIVSGMKAYIPHNFSLPNVKMPLFNHACSHAIKDREAVYKTYVSLQTPENHAFYISARNRTKSILRNIKYSFINRKCANLSSSNSSNYFWQLTKNIFNNFTSSFPPLLNLMAALLSLLSLKLNSSLRPFLQISLWTIQGIFLLFIPLPLTLLCH